MKFLTAAVTLLTVLGVNAYQQCAFEKQDLLQTGTVQFNNDGSGKEHCYTVGIDYEIPKSGIQTAVSTENLNGYRPNSGLDYSVRANKKDRQNAISLSFLSGNKDWKKVSVSYLATSRDDIHAGSFIADTYSAFGCSDKAGRDIFSHSIHGLPDRAHEVATFISGIKTQQKRQDVEIQASSYSHEKGELEVRISAGAKQGLENVHVSYVIWNPKTQLTLLKFDPTSTAHIGDYRILGASKFSNSIPDLSGLGIITDRLTCVGTGCKDSKCFTRDECKKYNGVEIPKSRDCLTCGPFQKIENYKCVPDCKTNEIFEKGICICKPGYIKLLDQCIWSCGVNQIWKNDQCVCDDGFAKLNGVCKQCPVFSTEIGGKCVCKKGYQWNNQKLRCDLICGPWQINVNNVCVCQEGYVRVNGDCKACPQHAHYKDGKCHCESGYLWQQKQFKCYIDQPTCPPRSKWNQRKLQCQCTGVNQYLIDGLCRRCAPNQGWNGEQCVCVSGYNKIDGVCRTCDPNSTYNGRDCICNHGFYGNADKCDKCHSSCGKCSGPKDNQCITCSDVSYDLIKGKCIRNTPCPTGLFLDGDSCKPCSSYCDTCSSENVCDKCIQGFKLQKLVFLGQTASYCTQICGDGRRFELQCDDGNTRKSDGCNDYCEVQKGYHCQGGSSIKPSNCVPFLPDKSYISTTGTVHLFGRVVQGIRLSYIPPELTKNECALCSKLLWVRVIDSKVVPGVRINYLPKSKYQFLAEFEFNGLFAIPVFSVSIQINPDYAKYFSDSDMAQIEVKRIDPSVLKKGQKVQTLGFNDIFGDQNKIPISQQDLEYVIDG